MRYICIHSHFYQPPRENPWLEAIQLQDSAYPYHDWNERITAECYAPNAACRILDAENRIVKIVNNYARTSFNVGPTLLSWLEEKNQEVYRAILEADRESQNSYSGHGSALAQPYNHMILPLASRRDKYTQVVWGMKDFVHRFDRPPEGMWLPETAVDLETLDIMAELGIRFTILAPHQARRVRRLGSRAWRDVSGGRIDPTTAYRLRLPSRRTINLFFYDGPVSRAVAFEGLLNNGEEFAQRLLSAFSKDRPWPELVHIATDGETYGHHHRYGDMALAYALHYIESNKLAQITNYGEYLERYPPTHEVEIVQKTSWSCAHGVERWRSDCGCSSGRHPDWSQAWRAPLREALDWLRDTLVRQYDEKAGEFVKDPRSARNDYIDVILDRSPECIDGFLSQHATHELSEAEQVTLLKLLEIQRHAMLMYTSCGWFFDELSGIETVQILQYAGRAVQLAEELFGDALETHFLEILERAKSNIPEHKDGRHIYERFVKPAMVNWERAAAHYAVSSLFETYPEQARIYCYTFRREHYQSFEAGRAKLVVGRGSVTSEITREVADVSFGVLHFGDHNLHGGVRKFRGEPSYQAVVEELADVFTRAEFPEVIRLLDRTFGEPPYSLKSLFRDEQRRIVNRILESTLVDTEAFYRRIYQDHSPLMRFITELSVPLTDLRVPLPKAFHMAAEFILNIDLHRALQEDAPDLDRIHALLEEAGMWHVQLDFASLGYALQRTIERLAERFRVQTGELPLLQWLEGMVNLARSLPFSVDLWRTQNAYYEVLQTVYDEFQDKAEHGDEAAKMWMGHFIALGEKLSVRVTSVEIV